MTCLAILQIESMEGITTINLNYSDMRTINQHNLRMKLSTARQLSLQLDDHAFMLKANLLIKPDVINEPDFTVRHKIATKDIMAFIMGQGRRLITLFEGE